MRELRKKTTFRLSETAMAELERLSDEMRKTKTEIIEEAIFKYTKKESSEKYPASEKFRNLDSAIKAIGKDVSVIKEMMNTLAVHQNMKTFHFTGVYTSPVLDQAEKAVTERIAVAKQYKDHRP
jgi:predicted DNA-binding protein